jgi:quinoprotein glucose dehydrogenase
MHFLVIAVLIAGTTSKTVGPQAIEWTAYGHDGGGSKFSPLKQITPSNVSRLKVAWTYHSKDKYMPAEGHGGKQSAFEATPLFINGVLYLSTAFGRVIALDPATGREKWAFDPNSNIDAGWGDFANRGVAAWQDPKSKTLRLYIGAIDARLICVEEETGRACPDFGDKGAIDLTKGLRNPPHATWEYEETSPPAVIHDLVIIGSGVADNNFVDAASGEVRAFDARTGKLRWTWDPMPGQKTGAANAWSIISVDPQRNLVFVPTGSASPDYFGGLRPGDNLYANSVVALRADTGERVWHFQTVHHDLWDYDVASQPTLIDIRRGGMTVPAVAIGSKTGNLFFLERETGKPIFGVEERQVPRSDVDGEQAAPTQPFPLMPKPLVSQEPMKPEDAFGYTEQDRKWCAEQIRSLRSEGIFTPPSLRGSLVRPGNIGGMHWGGSAFDATNNALIMPLNEFPAVAQLILREEFEMGRREHGWEYASQRGAPFAMRRQFLRTPSGALCTKPPFGELAAVDLATGELRWKVPLGTLPNVPGPEPGAPNLGGAIVTAGGIVFVGATIDAKFRAFAAKTGKLLWSADLPAGARATPMTYAVGGKQYVVIAAGGFDIPGSRQGDELVAFAIE